MNIEELQKQIDQEVHKMNHRPVAEFEGYSPYEMTQILYFTFGPDSPIQLQKLSDDEYKSIPVLNQTKYLTDLIKKNGEIKLTKKGFLPVKIVSELYHQGFLEDPDIRDGISKLYKESDSMAITLTRILIDITGLTKKRKGRLSLTKSSEKSLSDNHALLQLILLTFATKFNWAYFDGYGENRIGQLGYGFSLILLSKYGHEKRLDTFYAQKYFDAFPNLLTSVKPTYGTLESYTANCYSIRTFDRFLNYFGLIRIEKENNRFDARRYILKTDLFDKLIKCTPHKE